MCKYCKNWHIPYSKLLPGEVIIVACAKYTEVGDGQEHGVPMRYCPGCGRKLSKEAESYE